MTHKTLTSYTFVVSSWLDLISEHNSGLNVSFLTLTESYFELLDVWNLWRATNLCKTLFPASLTETNLLRSTSLSTGKFQPWQYHEAGSWILVWCKAVRFRPCPLNPLRKKASSLSKAASQIAWASSTTWGAENISFASNLFFRFDKLLFAGLYNSYWGESPTFYENTTIIHDCFLCSEITWILKPDFGV